MGKKVITNPYHIAAPPAQQDQWRHLSPIMLTLNQQGTPRSWEERAPPCVGYCCLPVGQSGPPSLPPGFGTGDEVLSSCLCPRLTQTLERDGQGRDPARMCARLTSPRSMGRAWQLRTLPAEANQFFWQVEAGVDLGAISREQAGAGKSMEQLQLPLCPHIHTRLGIQVLGKGPRENLPISPCAACENKGPRLFRLYHLRSSPA